MTARAQAMLEVVRALAPRVEAGAEEAERRRDLPKWIVEDLSAAGVFQMLVPVELGGGGFGPLEALPVIEELARQDASTGWCAGTAAIQTAIVALRADDKLAREIFRDPRAVCAGGLAPMARGRRVDGGLRVRGRFSFGSGVRFATTVVGGCLLEDADGEPVLDDGAPQMLAICLAPEDVVIHDNWHVSGLEATASCEYSVAHDRPVPDPQVFALQGPARRDDPLGRLPLLSIAYIGHLSFALGVGRRALEDVRAYAQTRLRLMSRNLLAQRATFQRQLAEHEARLDAARLLALDAFGRLWEAAAEPGEVSLERRADVAQAAVHAAEVSAGVTDFAFRSGGATSVYRSQRIQRCFRDMFTARQHIAVADEIWERVGRVRLGLATPDELV